MPCIRAEGHVVKNRFRERVRPLEDHTDIRPQLRGVNFLRVDVLIVEENLPSTPRPGNEILHSVKRTQKRRLPLPEGPMMAVICFSKISSEIDFRARSCHRKSSALLSAF